MERFQEKLDRTPSGCWEWRGTNNPQGYGLFWYEGRIQLAHRVAMKLEGHTLSRSVLVLHECDNPSCCRPSHLKLGTHADNMADAKIRGRLKSVGETNPRSKLTEPIVLSIRERHASGEKQNALAKEFGVSPRLIYAIVHRKRWTHI